ncbi:MAG: endonuclease/exonuclease/phosphatase family protein [Planctomycetota bacterium]
MKRNSSLCIRTFLIATVWLISWPTTLPGADKMESDTNAIRIATFNVSLYGKNAGEIRERLSESKDAQAQKIAAIVQIVRPDVLLVNELDFEPDSAPAKLLAKNYFGKPQRNPGNESSLEAIDYPFLYSAPSNTGIDSGMDLNRDGKRGSGDDAWGYGVYPGQYAMTVFSRFPIKRSSIRSFQKFLWKDMPGALRPIDPKSKQPFHPDSVWDSLRLSSKNHIDVPIQVGNATLHVLGSHPTPPVFDGVEDRNGARNHDEIDFWNRYLTDQEDDWIVDDGGKKGGFVGSEPFVIMGDLNADPVDGDGRQEAIRRLMNAEIIQATTPLNSDKNLTNAQRVMTANFGRNGRMRVDYVLPSRTMKLNGSGVFWPPSSDPQSKLIDASDHRLVWIDVELPL